jgi:hypothetical protein
MKRLLLAALCAATPLFGMAQVNVGVNLNIGDPNFYGQVDLDQGVAPPVIYNTPVAVQPAPPGVYYPPVYLRVPPIYVQNWPQYCYYYNACNMPVFFVQENWYLTVYAPMYRSRYPYGHRGFVPRAMYQRNAQPPQHVEQRHDERGDHRKDERHEDERR